MILTRVLTKLSTVKKLALAKASNRGRLKASWLTPVRDGVIKISGAYQPPAWVKKHVNGETRGYWRSDLENQGFPAFTVASYAKGLTTRAERYFINTALKIRAKAMMANAAMYASGKKYISEYAR